MQSFLESLGMRQIGVTHSLVDRVAANHFCRSDAIWRHPCEKKLRFISRLIHTWKWIRVRHGLIFSCLEPRTKVFFCESKRVFLQIKNLFAESLQPLSIFKVTKSLSHLESLFFLYKIRYWRIFVTRPELDSGTDEIVERQKWLAMTRWVIESYFLYPYYLQIRHICRSWL